MRAPRPISNDSPLLLGSASPRRRDILRGLEICVRILPAEVDECLRAGETPDQYLQRIIRDKLSAVAERLRNPAPSSQEDWLIDQGPTNLAGILVADTIVVVDEHVLGKPQNDEHAVLLLDKLVGRTHVVKTRYALALPAQPEEPVVERTVTTRVTMRGASAVEIRRYARSGEGRDKAGAYAAQGIGAFLIERIDGSYSNVIGLPACEVVQDLQALGLLGEFP